jgi:hypothetical protein
LKRKIGNMNCEEMVTSAALSSMKSRCIDDIHQMQKPRENNLMYVGEPSNGPRIKYHRNGSVR